MHQQHQQRSQLTRYLESYRISSADYLARHWTAYPPAVWFPIMLNTSCGHPAASDADDLHVWQRADGTIAYLCDACDHDAYMASRRREMKELFSNA